MNAYKMKAAENWLQQIIIKSDASLTAKAKGLIFHCLHSKIPALFK
jgi:hypothetical protein